MGGKKKKAGGKKKKAGGEKSLNQAISKETSIPEKQPSSSPSKQPHSNKN